MLQTFLNSMQARVFPSSSKISLLPPIECSIMLEELHRLEILAWGWCLDPISNHSNECIKISSSSSSNTCLHLSWELIKTSHQTRPSRISQGNSNSSLEVQISTWTNFCCNTKIQAHLVKTATLTLQTRTSQASLSLVVTTTAWVCSSSKSKEAMWDIRYFSVEVTRNSSSTWTSSSINLRCRTCRTLTQWTFSIRNLWLFWASNSNSSNNSGVMLRWWTTRTCSSRVRCYSSSFRIRWANKISLMAQLALLSSSNKHKRSFRHKRHNSSLKMYAVILKFLHRHGQAQWRGMSITFYEKVERRQHRCFTVCPLPLIDSNRNE